MQTTTLVQVVACTNNGDVSPVGLVDVVPMVHQVDGQGSPVPHTIIFNIPYLRIQGGTNAIIMDPEKDDIGICLFADKDISKVKSTKAPSLPGSYRRFSYSDGLYIGGVLNRNPLQYIQFSKDGITIKSPNVINILAPSINLKATS